MEVVVMWLPFWLGWLYTFFFFLSLSFGRRAGIFPHVSVSTLSSTYMHTHTYTSSLKFLQPLGGNRRRPVDGSGVETRVRALVRCFPRPTVVSGAMPPRGVLPRPHVRGPHESVVSKLSACALSLRIVI